MIIVSKFIQNMKILTIDTVLTALGDRIFEEYIHCIYSLLKSKLYSYIQSLDNFDFFDCLSKEIRRFAYVGDV